MSAGYSLGVVAAWFVLGMTRIVFTSKLAECRIDNPDPGMALAINRNARSARLDTANYDLRGRRMLPWFRAVDTSYWIVAAGTCLWALCTT